MGKYSHALQCILLHVLAPSRAQHQIAVMVRPAATFEVLFKHVVVDKFQLRQLFFQARWHQVLLGFHIVVHKNQPATRRDQRFLGLPANRGHVVELPNG